MKSPRLISGMGLACAVLLGATACSSSEAPVAGPANMGCDDPTEVQGFLTCADVEAAKQEGKVVLYAPAGEDLQVELLREFNELFPEIEVQSLWAQTGSLYTKVKQEIQTDNTLVDVLVLSDPTLLMEMQTAEDLAEYNSPAIEAYTDANVKSDPAGYWTSWGMIATSIAYNEETIGDNPPEDWEDLLDPKYEGRANLKNTTSGLQFAQWKALSDEFGEEYWTEGIASLKPYAFDSFNQQFDRLVSGEDLVAINGQISGVMQYLQKGAPLKIVYPEGSGVPATLEAAAVMNDAPHPEAARLLLDWLLSVPGQEAVVDIMQYFSSRTDVAAPEGAGAPDDVKFLVPTWSEMPDSRPVFEDAWKVVLGG